VKNADYIKAASVKSTEYPQDLPCVVCKNRWMQHKGTLCPAQVGGILMIEGQPVCVEARFPLPENATTFIPDLEFLKQPDFDVV
jgi:hypothetical protein